MQKARFLEGLRLSMSVCSFFGATRIGVAEVVLNSGETVFSYPRTFGHTFG